MRCMSVADDENARRYMPYGKEMIERNIWWHFCKPSIQKLQCEPIVLWQCFDVAITKNKIPEYREIETIVSHVEQLEISKINSKIGC